MTLKLLNLCFLKAIANGRKRIVTLQWLNEAIMKKKAEPPTKACHLPTIWCENNRPAMGKVYLNFIKIFLVSNN